MQLKNLFTSSVGKKYLVGITGLGMGVFLLSHVAANMLILFDAQAYNRYSHALATNPLLLYPSEILLVLAFVVHVLLAISLTVSNRRARGAAPIAAQGNTGKRGDIASRTMIYTGLVLLVFVPLHLITFKYGPHYTVVYDGVTMRDLHKLVLEKFQDPLYVGWYVVAVLLLGVHLSHGFAATMQSLGVESVREKSLRRAGWLLAAGTALGFASQPLYVFLSALRQG